MYVYIEGVTNRFFILTLLLFLGHMFRRPHGTSQSDLAGLDELPSLPLRIHHGNVMLHLRVGIVVGFTAYKVHLRVFGGLQQQFTRRNALAAGRGVAGVIGAVLEVGCEADVSRSIDTGSGDYERR